MSVHNVDKGKVDAMKKTYSTPRAKLINFEYDEQVVAASTGGCDKIYTVGSMDFDINPDCAESARDGASTYALIVVGCGVYTQNP